MSVVRRYVILQIPGWILAAVILYALHRWFGLPSWIVFLLLAADIVKDIALYPFLKRAYEDETATGAQSLIGEWAEVCEPMRPAGYVRLRGELWKARLKDPGAVAEPGARVRVEQAAGLLLQVSLEPPETSSQSAGPLDQTAETP